MESTQATALQIIESLLKGLHQLQLPEHWQSLTPQDLQLDSLDWVELQLELETACDVTLFDDSVTQSNLIGLSFSELAARIDAMRQKKR